MRSSTRIVIGTAVALALFTLATYDLAPPARASGALNVKGRWTTVSRQYWNGSAVHMVLLRGRSDSTRVLFFKEDGDTLVHLWLWDPTLDSNSLVVGVPFAN